MVRRCRTAAPPSGGCLREIERKSPPARRDFPRFPRLHASLGALAALTVAFLCRRPTVEQMERAVEPAVAPTAAVA